MRKFVFIILGIVLVASLTACGKKQQTLEEMQEPMSMEALSKMPAEGQVPAAQPAQAEVAQPAAAQSMATTEQASLITSAAKPTNQEIQTALKNANFYTGNIDGKIGPMTKKAIEEFQKANNLKADGKVGAKTWTVLSKYLAGPVEIIKEKKKR